MRFAQSGGGGGVGYPDPVANKLAVLLNCILSVLSWGHPVLAACSVIFNFF